MRVFGEVSELRDRALFGLIDGLNGAVGLVIGLLHARAAAALIFVALLARAGSSAVSMAGAQFGSSTEATDNRMGLVAAMGLGYLTSALLPGLGFVFGLRPGMLIFAPASAVVLVVITWARAHRDGWLKASATTLVVFVLAIGAGLLASLAG